MGRTRDSGLGSRNVQDRAGDPPNPEPRAPSPEPRLRQDPDNMPPFGGSMKTMSMTGLCVLAMSVCAAAPVLAQPPAAPPAAPQGRGNSPAASVVSPEISADRRVTFRIYAPKAQAVRLGRRRHSRRRPDHAADERRERRLGGRRSGRSTRAPIATTSTSTASRPSTRATPPPAIEHQRLEPGLRARLGLHGHARRAARRGRRGDLLLDAR